MSYRRYHSPRAGHTIDPRWYGVVADGTTDDTTAMQACLDDAVDKIVDFRWLRSQIRISTPLHVWERTRLEGPWSGMWPYRYAQPYTGSIKALSGFTGAAGIYLRENNITSRADECDGVRLRGVHVDMSAATGNLDAFRVEGECRDLHFEWCAGTHARGTGRNFNFLTGTGTVSPRGVRMDHCVAYAGANHGFRFDGMTDFTLHDLLAVSNLQRGFYFTSPAAAVATDCHSVFNTFEGFYIDGSTTSGTFTLLAPTTDRNGRSGIRIQQTGTQPVKVVGPILRRDGSASTSLDYAGILVDGTVGNTVVPVDIVAPHVVPGVDDGGAGLATPQHGIRCTYAQRVNVEGGDIWGISSALSDGGNNTSITWSPGTYWASGAIGAKSRARPTAVGTAAGPVVLIGTGTPEAAVTANIGSIFMRTDGGAATSMYVKESGTAATGWVAK